ncbi:HEPN domain-containing protein [Hydrogenivirga sp. 128-5-R1-1]|uniref:HEPN domain-containing protein n=1 Tax=Hydrogenivirga sp. 128-5-R1-1 TaxID=392423 RepID=UPI00015F391A|nr:HEPN domain-containing protein [Hydrogenivirga sp. 128-5-R1-1]EDP75085.1 hypothetical protein HG1285_14494 [Hydrogenivirga sp. 128-5-R1-1]
MSEENRFSLEDKLRFSELYLKKAESILREFDDLYEKGFFLNLCNRAYYVVFNMSKSLLILSGRDPQTEREVKYLLYVALPHEKEMHRLLRDLEHYRSIADYDLVMDDDISPEEALEVKEKAKMYVEIAKGIRESLVRSLAGEEINKKPHRRSNYPRPPER